MTILQDIFRYFAKYPSEAAIAKIFTKTASNDPQYQSLRDATIAKSSAIFPAITDYIFGVNEEAVKRRISQVKGIYLFVDYGNISSMTSSKGVKEDSFQLAVTVAKPVSSATFDQAEDILIAEQLLEIIQTIRRDLREDRSDPFVQRLSFPNDITPFFARELSNSYGWTLMFQMRGVDMV